MNTLGVKSPISVLVQPGSKSVVHSYQKIKTEEEWDEVEWHVKFDTFHKYNDYMMSPISTCTDPSD